MRRDERPNILLVMTDQLSAFATAPYGNREVQTPHLAALAGGGVVFERAYCNAPLCVPSRASLMTGQLPSRLPVNDNGEELPASVPTFAHHLRRGGYRTALTGKMHFVGPDQLHGFEERLTTDVYPSDFLWTPSWPRLRALIEREASDAADPHAPPRPPRRLMARCLKETAPVTRSMELAFDEEVQARALAWLRRPAFGRDARPWLLCVSYTHPHDPYNALARWWERYEGLPITPPEPPPPGHAPHPADEWANIHHALNRVVPTPEEVHRARRGYYASTSYTDEKLGELLRELDVQGLREDTLVIFTSDHGDMLGEHGMWFKRTVREWSARVPLVMAGPGVAAGHRVAANVSLVDLAPTLIALGDAPTPRAYDDFAPPFDGRSLVPLLRGGATLPGPNEVTTEYNGDGTYKPIRALVRDRWKFHYVHDAPDQLYDLATDPNEWHNLAAEPAHAARAASLRGAVLRDWDPAETERRVLASQRRRTFLNEALYQGAYAPWDYQPPDDAARMYVRRDPERDWAAAVYDRVLLDPPDAPGLRPDPGPAPSE